MKASLVAFCKMIFYLVLECITCNRMYTLQDLAVKEDFADIKKPSEPPFIADIYIYHLFVFFGNFC